MTYLIFRDDLQLIPVKLILLASGLSRMTQRGGFGYQSPLPSHSTPVQHTETHGTPTPEQRRWPRNHNEESLNLKSLLKQSPPEKVFCQTLPVTLPRDLGLSPELGSLSNVPGQKFFTLHLGMIKCGKRGEGGNLTLDWQQYSKDSF